MQSQLKQQFITTYLNLKRGNLPSAGECVKEINKLYRVFLREYNWFEDREEKMARIINNVNPFEGWEVL